ncbi:MAG: LysM peptidoglycan-binding domain-containing protein [Bacteroidetes bacterium]|nr:LysM peptidoglycan-binding domain-containing protein [Bacteroidota bacterium]
MRIVSIILYCSIFWIHPLLSQSHSGTDTTHIKIGAQDSSVICLPCNALQESPKLKIALQKLHNIWLNNPSLINSEPPKSKYPPVRSAPGSPGRQNPAGTAATDTLFTIIQIGDSHIQGDYFSGEIRKQLQGFYGNAGQGILFPYALAKSYGPRGTVAKPIGVWTGIKTMIGGLKASLGVIGYGATTLSAASSLSIEFNDKFSEPQFQKINIWHSADSQSFSPTLANPFQWTGSQFYPSGWGISSYQAIASANQFQLTLSKIRASQNHFGFYGFELVPNQRRGVVYHHFGVVGAQFTHLIDKAPWTIEQLQHLKPDIIIFSFGTNEAYNGKIDTLAYTQQVQAFLHKLSIACPQTAIILTTAPDTRSRNRIPPMQRPINNQLKTIAAREKLTVYDLNAAMGGWGSLHTWYKNQLTISDKLHFNAAGYALQGQLFTLSLMQAYNKVNFRDTLDITALSNTVHTSMKALVRDFNAQTMGNSLRFDSLVDANSTASPPSTSTVGNRNDSANRIPATGSNRRSNPPARTPSLGNEKIHVVKTGENLYRIGQIYHVSHEAIAKRNHLKNPTAIRPGQKLVIPKS